MVLRHSALHYGEYHYVECRVLLTVMPSALMLSVVMLNVAILSVVAPFIEICCIQNTLFSLQLTNGANRLVYFSLKILSSIVKCNTLEVL